MAETKGVLIRVPTDKHRALKVLAAKHDTTIQALMLAAIDRLTTMPVLESHGEPLKQ